ncbi:MAG TPA: YdbH domain-containing protein, partial [Sphingomicrobium sp.]|nr:YdbH domain-containing protein [Sphingomicrobium sp.]
GGRFHYVGPKPEAGIMVDVAFDLLSDLRFERMVIRLDGELAGEFATRFTIEQVSLGRGGGLIAGLARTAFSRVPLRVNLNISGPFRALIQMAQGFDDPTPVIAPVMPFPLDAPGIEVETRMIRKTEEQELVTPDAQVELTTQPPQPSE